MLHAHIFCHFLSGLFGGLQPLPAHVLNMVGDNPGLIISPELDFPKASPIGLRVEI